VGYIGVSVMYAVPPAGDLAALTRSAASIPTSSAVWLLSTGYDTRMSTVRAVDPVVATTDTHP
jgi:hypothetical protein